MKLTFLKSWLTTRIEVAHRCQTRGSRRDALSRAHFITKVDVLVLLKSNCVNPILKLLYGYFLVISRLGKVYQSLE